MWRRTAQDCQGRNKLTDYGQWPLLMTKETDDKKIERNKKSKGPKLMITMANQVHTKCLRNMPEKENDN